MNALRNALSGNRARSLLVGLAFLTARGMCAQQPTEADSAAVFALAVERIIVSDSIGHIQGSGPPVRLSEAPKAAWAARAVARLRTLERPGAEPELLSVTAPQFTGDTAVVYESRHRCFPGGYMGGTGTEYMFVRTAEGWQVAPGGGFDNIDGICLPRPSGKRAQEGGVAFSVDFGSAPVEAVDELFDVLHRLRATVVRVSLPWGYEA